MMTSPSNPTPSRPCEGFEDANGDVDIGKLIDQAIDVVVCVVEEVTIMRGAGARVVEFTGTHIINLLTAMKAHAKTAVEVNSIER